MKSGRVRQAKKNLSHGRGQRVRRQQPHVFQATDYHRIGLSRIPPASDRCQLKEKSSLMVDFDFYPLEWTLIRT